MSYPYDFEGMNKALDNTLSTWKITFPSGWAKELEQEINEMKRRLEALEGDNDDEEIELESALSEDSIYPPLQTAVYALYKSLELVYQNSELVLQIIDNSPEGEWTDNLYDKVEEVQSRNYDSKGDLGSFINDSTPQYLNFEVGEYE